MSWKKPEKDKLPTQTPFQSPPHPPVQMNQPPSSKNQAMIGSSIRIEGNLSGGEDLFVEGQIDGKIELDQHNVTIGTNGRIKADIHGRSITVMGEVKGNLYGVEQIILRKSSKVRGNLFAARVSLEDGADFKGSIDMTSKPAAEIKPPKKEDTEAKPPSHQLPGQDKNADKV